MILVLSLSPRSGLNPGLTPATLLARGALMQINEHPEWRQFLLLAATRRADEINRLRELQDDETVSNNEMTTATIPIEIGERSSTELPVIAPVERPPVITTPERTKAPSQSRRKGLRHARRGKLLAKNVPPPPINTLEVLFEGSQAKQKAAEILQPIQPVFDGTAPH